MKNWLKKLFHVNPTDPLLFTGALPDSRQPIDKTEDIAFGEVVASAAAVNWNKTAFRVFPELNQRLSYMCGAFSGKKHLGVSYSQKYPGDAWIDFSEEDIYQRRSNQDTPGMALWDIFRILSEGVTLKALTNATINTDADAETCKIDSWKRERIGAAFAIDKPVYVPSGAFETIASVIQTTGKTVICTMYFTADEWSLEFPLAKYSNLDFGLSLHHFANAVDFVTLNGVRYLVFEDSAHFGGISRRFVSKDFFVARNYPGATANGYMMNFKFYPVQNGAKYDGSIVSLQKCLQSIGLFPANVGFIESVGPITREAIKKFQAANGIGPVGTLTDETRALITSRFS